MSDGSELSYGRKETNKVDEEKMVNGNEDTKYNSNVSVNENIIEEDVVNLSSAAILSRNSNGSLNNSNTHNNSNNSINPMNSNNSSQVIIVQSETLGSNDGARHPNDRPIFKLSVKLIDTYKHINKVYYEAKAKRLIDQQDSMRDGVHNEGYDDKNSDYILQGDEIIKDRYILKHRMGKGSFGQVVCAYDREKKCEVAIKIIKSRKPFLLQAKTEIEILTKILENDENDESNIVRLQHKFIHRNHPCLVFEILSFNLYELLKKVKFRGVSLGLIRKFSAQLLISLEFLSRPEINIIHCDLKPENILLRHPRRSAIKLIDFGSSCYLNKRTYSYIQSRFYRSPEVLFGLPYTQKIDMWSLGCVAVEMHTGEPLFGGSNQCDQVCRIIDILGPPPLHMIKACPEKIRNLFFERIEVGSGVTPSEVCDVNIEIFEEDFLAYYVLKRPNKGNPPPRTLREILGVETGGPSERRKGEAGHTTEDYLLFLDFIEKLLVYDPNQRASAQEMLSHPYVTRMEQQESSQYSSSTHPKEGPPQPSNAVQTQPTTTVLYPTHQTMAESSISSYNSTTSGSNSLYESTTTQPTVGSISSGVSSNTGSNFAISMNFNSNKVAMNASDSASGSSTQTNSLLYNTSNTLQSNSHIESKRQNSKNDHVIASEPSNVNPTQWGVSRKRRTSAPFRSRSVPLIPSTTTEDWIYHPFRNRTNEVNYSIQSTEIDDEK